MTLTRSTLALAIALLSAPTLAGAQSRSGAVEPRLRALDNTVAKLERESSLSGDRFARSQLRRATDVWAYDPGATAAVLTVLLDSGLAGEHRVRALIEAARAEVAIGDHAAAMAHFYEAAAEAPSGHATASAFEGYVAAAAHVDTELDLPHLDRYIENVGRAGTLDVAGYEALYRLGRLLVTRGDDRGFTVMQLIKDEVPAGRRALYVRGADQLRRGNKEPALELFTQAAELPPYPAHLGANMARDIEVTEMAWFAVGRLSFDAGDSSGGFYAYQQIAYDSPRFLESFYELGWLAIEHGQELTARLAFEPVVQFGSLTEWGRRAQLLSGYILLQKGEFVEAEQHYVAVAQDFTNGLERFDAAVASVANLEDLARECDTRDRALRDPYLAPVLRRDGVRAARKMVNQLEGLRTTVFALERRVEELDRMLAGEGEHNPFMRLEHERKAARDTLRDVQDLSLELDRGASTKAQCCSEPRLHSKHLHDLLETQLRRVDDADQRLRESVTTLRSTWLAGIDERKQKRAELEPALQKSQREAVASAIDEERQYLRTMVMEGESGVLQSVWELKERVRNKIGGLEQERKRVLDELLWAWADVLE